MKTPDKRDDIMQATLELIAEHGFHGTSMAMIGERADVGAGTIYRYFKSKENLINAVNQELTEKIVASLLQAGTAKGKPLRERFLYLATGFCKYLIDHPIHFCFLEQYYNSPYGVSFRRERLFGKSKDHDIFLGLFEEGIKQKTLKDLPLPLLFALAFGPIIAMMRDHILGFIVLNDTLLKKTVEACWDGVKR
ncbi:MAG: TetR/AcrR family transcriptional regulator [Deltaproteobacteria bacterium]|nr:TetR/AcrR family transcriptional regulator [Deltaproteobacteria bacterium]